VTTLLIGATGFLGSAVAARLATGQLAALVRPASDRSCLPAGVDVRVGDLGDAAGLAPSLVGVDRLVYCASMGFGHVPALVHALHRAGVRRAVFVSTTALFTRLPAASRAVRADAEAATRASALAWTILRPTMIYGTARDRNVSRLLRVLRRTPVFPVFGAGTALQQPIFVDDLADAVVAALDSDRTIAQAYNLAGGDALSYAELVRTAARAVGRAPRLVYVPLPVTLAAAKLAAHLSGHVWSRLPVGPEQILRLAEDKVYDCSPAAQDFGFRARTFAQGVAIEAVRLGLAPPPATVHWTGSRSRSRSWSRSGRKPATRPARRR